LYNHLFICLFSNLYILLETCGQYNCARQTQVEKKGVQVVTCQQRQSDSAGQDPAPPIIPVDAGACGSHMICQLDQMRLMTLFWPNADATLLLLHTYRSSTSFAGILRSGQVKHANVRSAA
jgi:hypothetical protein